MFAALIGFGGFLLSVGIICVIGYRYADRLEAWARRHFGKKRTAH